MAAEREPDEQWWREAPSGVRAWLDEQWAHGYDCMCIEWKVMPPLATVARSSEGQQPAGVRPQRELTVSERDALLAAWPQDMRTPLPMAVAALGWLVADPREDGGA